MRATQQRAPTPSRPRNSRVAADRRGGGAFGVFVARELAPVVEPEPTGGGEDADPSHPVDPVAGIEAVFPSTLATWDGGRAPPPPQPLSREGRGGRDSENAAPGLSVADSTRADEGRKRRLAARIRPCAQSANVPVFISPPARLAGAS